eukprot:c11757_g1_i1.p1 GENE.c11757_g1_i1~~c11757_g1_i1.p1  ORF type:complete len:308 (+),score=64.75 c11757_g1_i1:1117-2040(+)
MMMGGGPVELMVTRNEVRAMVQQSQRAASRLLPLSTPPPLVASNHIGANTDNNDSAGGVHRADGWNVRVEIAEEAVREISQLMSAVCSIVVAQPFHGSEPQTHESDTLVGQTDSQPDDSSAKGNAKDALQLIQTIIRDLGEGRVGLDRATQAIRQTLHKNTSLGKIHFSDNNVGDLGARALANALRTNTTIMRLELGMNNVGDEGARVLADALMTNTALIRLDLGKNVSNQGARALADALRTNKTLQVLDLSRNKIGDLGGRALLEALQANTTLKKLFLVDTGETNTISSVIRNEITDKLRRRQGTF